MNKLKCAVIGVGYLGRFHAQKYAAMADKVDLVAVCDVHAAQAQDVAQELGGIAWFDDYTKLLGLVDAVSIATITQEHYRVAKFFLKHGVHVLLEKPITETLEQAEELISLAKQNKLILQVGHIENFNPAKLSLDKVLDAKDKIKAVNCHRVAPYGLRSANVHIVLDLMIHDLEIVLQLLGTEVVSISARGVKMASDTVDLAICDLTFASGSIAHLFASRLYPKAARHMDIVQSDKIFVLDYMHKTLAVSKLGQFDQDLPIVANDALLSEIQAFVSSVKHNIQPKVDGIAGYQALVLALKIAAVIENI
jgi:predicted dehydrogenase